MNKVVYNSCFGGYSLSQKAAERLFELGVPRDAFWEPYTCGYVYDYKLPRHDPRLVQVVEELGDEASGKCARLKVAIIEGDCYRIDEYDGREDVFEPNDVGQEWITIK